MHRSTLIHFVDPQELSKAEQDYLPLARKSIKPEAAGPENSTVIRHSNLLRATMPHQYRSPLMSAINEVATNIDSFEYYKKRFMKFLEQGFESKNRQLAIFQLVENAFAQMPAPASIQQGITAINAIVDNFAAEYQLVINEIFERLNLSERRDSPKTVFLNDGLLEAICGLFRRTQDESRIQYRRQLRDVCGPLLEWKKAYVKDMAERGRDPDDPNDDDKAEFLKMARSLVEKEVRAFTDKCAVLKAAMVSEFEYMHSVRKIKEISLDKVAAFAGDSIMDITARIENLHPENSDADVDSFLTKVKSIIERVEAEKDGKETTHQDLQALRLSQAERNFLLRYLNDEYLVGVTHYHRDELSRYFTIPHNAIIPKITLERTRDGDLLLHIQERYRELHLKSVEQPRGYLTTQPDLAQSVTTLRFREQRQNNIEVTVLSSELHLYDKTLRQHYLSNRIFEQNGILHKILSNQPLLKNDHAVIEIFSAPYQQTEEWAVNLTKLEDKTADELFVVCWRDEFTMKEFFESENYKTTNDQHPNLNSQKRHSKLLQRFCQLANPVQRIEILQNKYRYHDMGVNRPIVMMENLKSYLEFVQQGQWKIVAELLNHEDSRDLMMAALNSLTDQKAIKKALSISAIRYSLDRDTLAHFAMQHEDAAKQILKQSIWQSLAVKIAQHFKKGRFWGVPAKTLINIQVAQIARKHPRLWQTRLKEHGRLYFSLTGHKNFRSEMTRKEMAEIWFNNTSAASKTAVEKAIFSDSTLWSKIAAPIANQQDADTKLRLLAMHGFSYGDRQDLKFGHLFNRGFIAAADQASEAAIEDFFFAQFKRIYDKPDYVTELKQTVDILWNGNMDLPQGANVVPCVKRAMIRAIRLRPETYQLFDGVKGRVYRELLNTIIEDDVILAAFMLQEEFLVELRQRATDDLRAKILNKIKNSMHMFKEGYESSSQFNKSHLIAAYSLFTYDERVLREHKDINEQVIDQLLNNNFKGIDNQFIISLLANATSNQLIALLLRQNDNDDPIGFYRNAKKAIIENPVLYKKALDVVLTLIPVEQKDAVDNDNNRSGVATTVTYLPWKNLVTLCNAQPEILRILLKENLLTDNAGCHLLQHFGFRNLSPSDLSKLKAIPGVAECVKINEDHWRDWSNTLVRDELEKHVKNVDGVTAFVVKSVKSLMNCFKAIDDPNQLLLEIVEIVKTCNMELPTSRDLQTAAERCGQRDINHLNVSFALSRIFNDYSFNSRLFANQGFSAESAVIFYQTMIKQNAFNVHLETFTTNILTVACRNAHLRDKILANKKLQKYIAQFADVEHVILFLQSASPQRTSIVSWHTLFEKFLTEPRNDEHARMHFHQHLKFLMQNVDGFAGWALAYLARHPNIDVPEQSLRLIMQYRVRGADLLQLMQTGPEYRQRVRHILLDPENADLFKRILEHQFDLDQQYPGAVAQLSESEFAADLIHLLIDELNEVPRAQQILSALTANKIMHFMLSFANAIDVLDLLRTDQNAIPLMISLFTENAEIRKKVLASEDLLNFLLESAPGDALIEWVASYNQCAVRVLANFRLAQRYFLVAGHNGRAELLMRAFDPRNDAVIETYLPQVMLAFPNNLNASVIKKILRTLINHVKDIPAQREELFKKLQSPEFVEAMTGVDIDTLYDLYMHCTDRRAMNLLFYKHPIMQQNLMARMWFSATADQILEMLRVSYDTVYDKKASEISFAGKMLSVLLQYLDHANPAHLPRSTMYAEHLLQLFETPDLLDKILSVATIMQVDQLLASNPLVATKVMDYFKAKPDEFRAMLRRGANQQAIRKFQDQFHVRQSSLLDQLSTLFEHHAAVRDLFSEHIKIDPELFAEIVLRNMSETADYRAAVKIVNHLAKVQGGDFYAMYARRGYNDPTMIFLMYVMVGGDAMRQLYNTGQQLPSDRKHYRSHIATITRLWELCYGSDNDHPEYRNYFIELRSAELAENHFSLKLLLSDGYREFGDGSRAVKILHKLFQIRTLFAEKMLNSGWLEQLNANGDISREELYLLTRALNELVKMAKSFFENSTPMQLVELVDIENSQFDDFKPIRNFLLSDDKTLDRIVKDHAALAAFLVTRAYKEHVQHAANLKEILISIEDTIVNKRTQDRRYLKMKGKMDFEQCSVDQYRIYLAEREYYEFSKELGFNIGNTKNYLTLLALGDDDNTRITGLAEHPSTHQIIEPKYLSCYYYSRFLTNSAEFIQRLAHSITFRNNFCQQFEFNREAEDPITLSLSGIKPGGDLMVLYVFARSLSDPDFVDRNLKNYLLNHAVVRRENESFRFAGTFRYVPEEILEYFGNIFTKIEESRYQNHWQQKFHTYEHLTGSKISSPSDMADREDDSVGYAY